MNLFLLTNIAISSLCGALAIFTFFQGKNKTHFIWAIFNTIVSVWALALYFVATSKSPAEAISYWKIVLIPNTFISILLYHLVHSFCDLKGKRFLFFAYLQGLIFALYILFPNSSIGESIYIFDSIYYVKASIFFSIWLSFFTFITAWSFYEVFKFIRVAPNDKKVESLYLFWGMLIGFGGGLTLALPAYNILIYPAWHSLICIYVGIFSFAILRHRFLGFGITLTKLFVPTIILVIIAFVFSFNYFKMNLFSSAGLSLGLICFLLVYIIFAYAKQKIHYIWACFNIVVALWGFAAFFIGRCTDPQLAIIIWRISFVAVIFIAVFFYHVSCLFCQINRPRTVAFAYMQGLFFIFLNATDLYISKVFLIDNSFYYLRSQGFFYPISFFIWFGLVSLGLYELIVHFRKATGIKKQQLLYLFIGFGTGFIGGISNFLPTFGIHIYPFGNLTIPIYCVIATYAILRYQLMDIRIAVTRVGIFILVYSLILGVPFGLTFWGKESLVKMFGEYWYWAPIILSTIFATTGPFVYLYLQRKAEEQILQEEQRTQALLEQASYGMNTLHTLEKLLKLIVDVVIKTLAVDTAKIYLLNREAEQYILRAPKAESESVFDKEDALIQFLKKKQYPLVYDEIKILSDMEDGDVALSGVEVQMKNLSANIIVPITLNNSLLGFLTLGERKSRRMYTRGLLNTLSILGNQCALAIDRCNVLEAETKRLEAEGLKERMVSLDHMASSMAHEIDNPMHIIRTSLSFVQGALLKDPRVAMPAEVKQDFDESLTRSLNASDRVSSMIKAILDYSRMGTGKLESFRISDALEGFLQLIQPQIKEEKVQFTTEIEDNLPMVLGDRVQMEEVFMNFVRNSLHAIRRNEEKKISLKIFKKNETIIRIECADNGYGIPREIINDIFLSSMTTKGSSEGTGLGLYRVRKIVDLFRGKVWAESEGKEKGATFIVELPVYENHNNVDKNEKS